jgi:hypothetical protein
VAFAIHQLEEYFGGFLEWYPMIMNAKLSSEDFILINTIALLITVFFAMMYSLGIRNNFIFVVIGSLFFVNGIVHLMATIFSWSYSPGVISGLVIFLPLGRLIYHRIYPQLPENQRIPSILIGILLLFTVSMIARSMATV